MDGDMKYLQCWNCDRVYSINYDGLCCEKCGGQLKEVTPYPPWQGGPVIRKRPDGKEDS